MKGTVIEVTAAMPAKVLSGLNKEGIPTGDAVRLPGGMRFTVPETYTPKTFAFLENLCYTYSVVAGTGRAARCKRAVWRLGLVAGVAAVAVGYALLAGRVWRIRVEGNERLSDKAVLELLTAQGVKRGVKSKFDFSSVERALRDTDELSECTLSLRGTTLTVTVIEETEITPPDTSTARADIASAFDATVTRVVCEKGTAVVKPGDRIAAGATLIEGATWSTLGDDYGNPVLLAEFPAKGEVYGAVTFKRSAVLPETKTDYVRTGRKKTRTVLGLWGLSVGKDKSPYASYERVVSEEKLDFIPIRCRRITYYETEAVTAETDAEVAAAAMTDGLRDETALKSGNILSSTHTVTRGNGLIYIHCYVTAELPIGVLKS